MDSDLQNELPGILKLMLDGLRRLHLQGFTHTDYQTSFVQELEELGSPIRTFVRENCVLDSGKHISALVLWQAWQKWCEDYSHSSGCQSVFGRNLKSCFSEITKKRKEGDYCYFGIELKPMATPLGLRVYHPSMTDRVGSVAEQMVQ